MNKRQRKRKEKEARRKRSKESRDIAPTKHEVENDKLQTEDSSKGQDHTDHEGQFPMNFKEWMSHAHIPNWVVAVFTGALTVIAGVQACLVSNQTDAMRKDQRPWIKIGNPGNMFSISEGAVVLGTIQPLNSGKTPAKHVQAEVMVREVGDNDPVIDYSIPHFHGTTGLLYPNVAVNDFDAIRVGTVKPGSTGEHPEIEPLPPENWKRYSDGTAFYVLYGKISYFDFFKVEHWTHFCAWYASSAFYAARRGKDPPPSVIACTDYNDVDDN